MIKVLVIGCGPHATHFHLPELLRRQGADGDVSVAGALDIEPNRAFVEEELASRGLPVRALFVEPFDGPDLPAGAEALLDDLVARGETNAVVIATDPLHHLCYARWALSCGLPILMDKPVTTREGAALDLAQAAGIAADFDDLLARWRALPEPRPPFHLLAHRRHHPGVLEARRIVREACARTGCPVTNVRGAHSDGQWRLPHEIVTQLHHSYHQGHGKLSHSGFHFLDCLVEFWREGLRGSGAAADDVECFASFLRPDGLALQMPRDVLRNAFGPDYDKACPETDEELARRYGACGEVDVEASFALRRGGVPFSLASLSLLHGGYARRSWLLPDRDLYKGNGRVKHEEHSIEVGPFLNVRIQSYQSKDRHDACEPGADEEPGGNNHYELLVFRNDRMVGGPPFERLRLRDLHGAEDFDPGSLFVAQVKARGMGEWLDAIRRRGAPGGTPPSSDFADHRMSVLLMSALYRSWCARRAPGASPLVAIPWETPFR